MNGDTSDIAVKRLLETLAETNRLLRDHAVKLRRSPAVTKARTSLEVVSYRNGPVLEGYVEAELTDGEVVCWCLDVRWTPDSWSVETTVDRKTGDRQKTVKELPTETATDIDGFLEVLERAVRALLALSIADA
jgi:hypothetical protein